MSDGRRAIFSVGDQSGQTTTGADQTPFMHVRRCDAAGVGAGRDRVDAGDVPLRAARAALRRGGRTGRAGADAVRPLADAGRLTLAVVGVRPPVAAADGSDERVATERFRDAGADRIDGRAGAGREARRTERWKRTPCWRCHRTRRWSRRPRRRRRAGRAAAGAGRAAAPAAPAAPRPRRWRRPCRAPPRRAVPVVPPRSRWRRPRRRSCRRAGRAARAAARAGGARATGRARRRRGRPRRPARRAGGAGGARVPRAPSRPRRPSCPRSATVPRRWCRPRRPSPPAAGAVPPCRSCRRRRSCRRPPLAGAVGARVSPRAGLAAAAG